MSQVRRNVIANALGQGWRAFMSLAFIPYYIQFLGAESYGLIGAFGVLQAALALLSMGMSPTLNREMARYTAGEHSTQYIHNLLRSFECICIGLAVFVSVSIGGMSGFLARNWFQVESLSTDTVASALLCMSIVLSLKFLEGLYQGALYGLQKQVWFNIANTIIVTLQSLGAIAILAWLSPTIEAFFLWQASISLLFIVVFAWGIYQTLEKPPQKAQFSKEALQDVWRFARGMLGISILSLCLTQMDKMLLSKLLTLKMFGFYTLAATVTGVIYMVSVPINSALYPHLVELVTQKNEQGATSMYHLGSQLLTLSIAPVALLLIFFADGILFMWTGKVSLVEYVAPIVSIMALGTLLNGWMSMPYHLQLAHGWTSLSLKINLVAVCFLGTATWYVVPIYGAKGAAWIWVILNSGYMTIGIYLMHRRLIPNEKWNWYIFDLGLPVGGLVSFVYLASWFKPQQLNDNRLHWFCFLLVVGVLSVLITGMLAQRIRKEIVQKIQVWFYS